MDRFKMKFDNSSRSIPTVPKSTIHTNISTRPIGLNTPMIDRVYKAKPGCSACGKKVA